MNKHDDDMDKLKNDMDWIKGSMLAQAFMAGWRGEELRRGERHDYGHGRDRDGEGGGGVLGGIVMFVIVFFAIGFFRSLGWF